MKERWPNICEYFGLVVVGPLGEGMGALLPGEYLQANKEKLEEKRLKGVDVWKEISWIRMASIVILIGSWA